MSTQEEPGGCVYPHTLEVLLLLLFYVEEISCRSVEKSEEEYQMPS